MKAGTIALYVCVTALIPFRAESGTVSAIETATGTAFSWRNVIGANQSADIGWSFTVGAQDLQLTALGIYDQNLDGLEDSHVVAIWTNGGTLITEATIPSGTAGSLVGSYRYESVTPVTLLEGQTYVLGAHFAPVADLCGSACGDASLSFGTETFDPGITYLTSRMKPAAIGDASPAFPNADPRDRGRFIRSKFPDYDGGPNVGSGTREFGVRCLRHRSPARARLPRFLTTAIGHEAEEG